MDRLTRTINRIIGTIVILLGLLIVSNSTYAFFTKPSWLPFTQQKEPNFWSQLSQDFAIECDKENPSVQKQIRWYQEHPKHLQHILKKAEPFIHYVYEQTQRHNLPAELALIPLLESEYNPAIGGRTGAAGLWQIMPGTARKFGLKINHSYDGRRDIPASTKAALTYLSYLYQYFNKNWLLALAAYDAGEGKVLKVAKRCSHDFWNLPLSKETKIYVPKILAIAHIIKQSNEYNIQLPNIPIQPSVQELTWNEAKVINVTETAKNLGVDDKTFRRYNPGFRKNLVHAPKILTILVPTNSSTPITTLSAPAK